MEIDPFKDPETPADEAKKRREAERVRRNDADLHEVMSTVRGRRFLWRMIAAAGTFGKSFDLDASLTAFNEGRRATGIALMQEAQRVSPALYLEMVHERITEENETARKEQADAKQE